MNTNSLCRAKLQKIESRDMGLMAWQKQWRNQETYEGELDWGPAQRNGFTTLSLS